MKTLFYISNLITCHHAISLPWHFGKIKKSQIQPKFFCLPKIIVIREWVHYLFFKIHWQSLPLSQGCHPWPISWASIPTYLIPYNHPYPIPCETIGVPSMEYHAFDIISMNEMVSVLHLWSCLMGSTQIWRSHVRALGMMTFLW